LVDLILSVRGSKRFNFKINIHIKLALFTCSVSHICILV